MLFVLPRRIAPFPENRLAATKTLFRWAHDSLFSLTQRLNRGGMATVGLLSGDCGAAVAREADEPMNQRNTGATAGAAMRDAEPSSIRKRSVSVAGHRTSVSLEAAFWDSLRQIAAERGQSVSELVTRIDRERRGNLSSAIRVFVLAALAAGTRGDA
jgi:predicted DNA-binding ribbon-helix-helix protein